MSVAMRLATASVALLIVVVIALAIRGPDDWSRAFSVFWIGSAGLAVLLGVAGVIAALTTTMRTRKRLVALALSLTAPVTAAWFMYEVWQLFELMN
jgi:multisubunit Na+/H+ antiporter MnhG subunit